MLTMTARFGYHFEWRVLTGRGMERSFRFIPRCLMEYDRASLTIYGEDRRIGVER